MVSIIVPIYNAAPYLRRCLDSLVNQSYENLEILLINDGSRDDSLGICREFLKKDGRIRLISQENAGVSAARNRGLALAAGKYFLFVDGDDFLPPKSVEVLRKAAGDRDLVIGAHTEFRGWVSRKIPRNAQEFSREQYQAEFDRFDPMLSTVWGKLYRRQGILGQNLAFDPKLSYCEDHVFNLQFGKHLHSGAVIPDVVYHYRLGGVASSLSYHSNLAQMNLELLKAYREVPVSQGFWEKKLRDQLRSSILHEILHLGPNAAVSRTEEILSLYGPLLEAPGMEAKQLVNQLYREKRWSIAAKSFKIAIWRRFGKRV